jgi:hypothetical protein
MRSGSASWKFQKRILIVLQKSFRRYRNRDVHIFRINFDIFIKLYKYTISYLGSEAIFKG